jgi:hypothetical protein
MHSQCNASALHHPQFSFHIRPLYRARWIETLDRSANDKSSIPTFCRIKRSSTVFSMTIDTDLCWNAAAPRLPPSAAALFKGRVFAIIILAVCMLIT